MAPTVLVVFVEEFAYRGGGGVGRGVGRWRPRPEMTRVFAESAEGWTAAREYGMSLGANAYSYDIMAKVVE